MGSLRRLLGCLKRRMLRLIGSYLRLMSGVVGLKNCRVSRELQGEMENAWADTDLDLDTNG
jgi:hypothetical protein